LGGNAKSHGNKLDLKWGGGGHRRVTDHTTFASGVMPDNNTSGKKERGRKMVLKASKIAGQPINYFGLSVNTGKLKRYKTWRKRLGGRGRKKTWEKRCLHNWGPLTKTGAFSLGISIKPSEPKGTRLVPPRHTPPKVDGGTVKR